MNELVDEPEVLRERVLAVRAQLAGGRPADAVELRVAASVAQLGLVARLVSPVLAVAVVSDELLELDLARTRWQRVLGGAFPLSVSFQAALNPGIGEADGHGSTSFASDRLVGLLARQVLDGPVRELVEATASFSVSRRVLWGNVASAVNGATSMIASGRPDLAGKAHVLASSLLDRSPLHGTGTGTFDGRFRRRSCCLIYRSAPNAAGPVCGDCVLQGGRTA